MPKFAYCGATVGTESQKWLRQFDTSSFTLPFAFHQSERAVGSLAVSGTDDNQFIIARGPAPYYEICRTTGLNTETLLYTHPTVIWSVRMVAGEERIYFSAPDLSAGSTPYPVNIYYLKKVTIPSPHPSPPPTMYKAFLYTTIKSEQLQLPNPCPPFTGEFWASYGGDFVFGDNDTLYLSSGGHYGLLQVGVFKIAGAGLDSVTGTIEQIYLGEGPIQQISFRSPQSLFFMRHSDVWKLDLGTMTETHLGSIPEATIILDVAEVGDGVPHPYQWIEWPIAALYYVFAAAAKAMWRFADAQSRRRARSATATTEVKRP